MDAETLDKLLIEMPIVGLLLYALKMIWAQLTLANADKEKLRVDKEKQLLDLYEAKERREAELIEENRKRMIELNDRREAQLNKQRQELEAARAAATELSVRNAETFRDIAFALQDIHTAGVESGEALDRLEQLIRQHVSHCTTTNASTSENG